MMGVWALVLFGLIFHCSSVDINDFYPYSESNNDTRLDGVSDTDDFGASISLNCGTIKQYKVSVEGFLHLTMNATSPPLVAFTVLNLSDSDISQMEVFYRVRHEFSEELRTKLFKNFLEAFRNYTQFNPTRYAVVTWILEQDYGSSADNLAFEDTFQVFYATDGATSLVVYLYADDQLEFASTSSSMGIEVCSNTWTHPSSGTPNIADDLVTGSNVGTPGMWMFLIKDSTIILPVLCSPGCSFDYGTCHLPNTCVCKNNGWKGVNCTTPACPDGCVNGQCNEPFNCTCNAGWSGIDCSTADCPSSCMNGMCRDPHICTCEEGWTGMNCDEAVCSTYGCVNGSCNTPDECMCYRGWTGNDCSIAICLGGDDCNGTCVVPGECICPPDYTGELCRTRITEPPPTDATEGQALTPAAVAGTIVGIIVFVFIVILLLLFIAFLLYYF